MQAWMIAFCVGIIASGFLPFLLPPLWGASLCLFSLLLHLFPLLRVPAAMLSGACWFLFWAHGTQGELWPESRTGEDYWAQGVIWSLPEANAQGGFRFRLRIESLCQLPGAASCVRWHEQRPWLALVSVYEPTTLQPGQHWQLLLRLQPPHGSANPGGFAYDTWLIQQGIRATGYVRASESNRLLAEARGRPWFNRLRHHLGSLMDRADGGLWLQAPLLKALALGDKSGIGDEQWALFTALGLNHLMVISGLHIGLVSAVSYRLALFLTKLFPAFCLAWGAPRCAVLCSALAATLYAGLAGFSLPALRALIMALVCLAAIGLQRQSGGRNVLVLALLLVLSGDPLAPQTAGFWLSFIAVAILMSQTTGNPVGTGARRWLRILGLQFLLCVGMLPVMGLFFQQGSLAAPLVNLAAIPWIGLLVVPLTLLGLLLLPLCFTAGRWLLNLSDWLLQAFMDALVGLDARLPLALIDVPQTSVLFWSLCLVALACLLVRRWVLRLVCVAVVGLLLVLPRSGRVPGTLQLMVLDVGQGLAVIIDTGSQRVLYDSGPRFSESFDAGNDVILPALRKLDLGPPEVVIISHGDLDHAGGLPALEKAFPEARFLGPDTSLFSSGLRSANCEGQRWSSGGARFTMLHPDGAAYSSNNASCVLQIELGNTRVLLPGDIERGVELDLLDRYPNLQADLLIAPHHGSNTSSSWPFVKRLRPELVVFSSGYNSRFGHPTAAVQYRYRVLGAQAYNTARSGALLFEIDNRLGLTRARETRREQRRFWHTLAPAFRPLANSVRGGGVW